tara:strand:+ start:2491 stop:2667 length:177 start_codon:yes stop_codon:yes gene_type:complete
MILPPHFIEKNKEILFHIASGHAFTIATPTWREYLPDVFKGLSCRRAETILQIEGNSQ